MDATKMSPLALAMMAYLKSPRGGQQEVICAAAVELLLRAPKHMSAIQAAR